MAHFLHKRVIRGTLPSSSNAGPRLAVSTRATGTALQTSQRVCIRTKSDCKLAISIYPFFKYNAENGGGWGTVEDLGGGVSKITFDASALNIPALSWKTAYLLGVLPIPPPLQIAIKPKKLEGTLNRDTGEMNLEFSALFSFTVGPLYRAPDLIVDTVLTTESSQGQIHQALGQRFANGNARLVGVATVPKTNQDWFTDSFLMLPTEALAVMTADFEFEP